MSPLQQWLRDLREDLILTFPWFRYYRRKTRERREAE